MRALAAPGAYRDPHAIPSRQDLIAEALRRDPSLRDLDAPGNINRLQAALEALTAEYALRLEVMRTQAAELEEAARLQAEREELAARQKAVELAALEAEEARLVAARAAEEQAQAEARARAEEARLAEEQAARRRAAELERERTAELEREQAAKLEATRLREAQRAADERRQTEARARAESERAAAAEAARLQSLSPSRRWLETQATPILTGRWLPLWILVLVTVVQGVVMTRYEQSLGLLALLMLACLLLAIWVVLRASRFGLIGATAQRRVFMGLLGALLSGTAYFVVTAVTVLLVQGMVGS